MSDKSSQQLDDGRAQGRPWRSTALRRLPWDALLALLGTVISAALMVFVIIRSNGDLIGNWIISPSVYLAIGSVVANTLLRYVFSRGVEISWWVKALKDGTKVRDLENTWLYGTSLWAVLLAGRHFNLVALASIVLALVPANAPLVQRASQTISRVTTSNINVSLVAAPVIDLNMATGMVAGRSNTIAYITSSFATVLQDHLVSAPIRAEAPACKSGTCKGIVRAAGYDISCVTTSRPFDKTARLPNETAADGTTAFEEAVVFGAGINYFEKPLAYQPGESVMNLSTIFKPDVGCKGNLTVRNCTLAPATLEYRVVLANGTISLDRNYTYEDDKVLSHHETVSRGSGAHPSVHGGVYLALNSMFQSRVGLSFGGPVGMRVTTSGLMALRYMRQKEREPGDTTYSECLASWLDPTPDLLATVREVGFRLAFQGNVSGVAAQEAAVDRVVTEVVYASDYLFLGIALGLIGLSAITVVPMLCKWWSLGREVSLSPIEVARAFAAPELQGGSGSNSTAIQLMREIGSKDVRYGEVMYRDQAGAPVTALAFAHPSVVLPPRNGMSYY